MQTKLCLCRKLKYFNVEKRIIHDELSDHLQDDILVMIY